MGIRPSLKLCMALVDFQRDKDGNITDPRWTLPIDTLYGDAAESLLEAPIPLPEKVDVASGASNEEWLNALDVMIIIDHGRNKELWEELEYDDEFGCSNVLAVVISSLPYSHDVLYALAEVTENGYDSRFQELPLTDPHDDHSEDARVWQIVNKEGGREYFEKQGERGQRRLHQAAKYQELLDRRHNYGQFRMSFNAWLVWAMYVFKDVLKMKVEPGMIRLGLYWRWS